MRALHEEGIRTTCFISLIFPGITEVEAMTDRVKYICNLVWPEILNLRGSYSRTILDYIEEKHPELSALYDEIYERKTGAIGKSSTGKSENTLLKTSLSTCGTMTPCKDHLAHRRC